MITNGVGNGSQAVGANAKVVIANQTDDDLAIQKARIQKQSDELSAVLSGSKDSVEISEKARTLSEATRSLQEAEKAVDNSPSSVVVKAPATMDTQAGRAQLATDYNAVLESYRSIYGEKEAMQKFDEFMQAEGFERVEPNYNGFFGNAIGSSWNVNPSDAFYGSVFTNELGKLFTGVYDNFNSNLHTRSEIKAINLNGETKYNASTYATFVANYSSDVHQTFEDVFTRNLDLLHDQTGLDIEGLMRTIPSGSGQYCAVSASSDLANITNDILKKAGIELKSGQNITLFPQQAEDGSLSRLVVGGNFDTSAIQDAVDKAVKSDPGILKKFENELNSVASLDINSLNEQFADSDRGVEFFDVGRTFVLSGDKPGAMVMADILGVKSTGYSYQKKVSDSFDPNADTKCVLVPAREVTATSDLANEIRNAISSGTTIDSTISEEEYKKNSHQVGNSGVALLARDDLTSQMISMGMTEEEMQAQLKAEEAAQAEKEAKASPPVAEDIEITYYDEKREIQKTTFRELIVRFQASQKGNNDLLKNLVSSLNQLYTSVQND